MCGIAGIISLRSAPPKSDILVDMADSMYYRGPDGEGYLLANAPSGLGASLQQSRPQALVVEMSANRTVLLAHRRLSIVDLSPLAAQPMTEISKRYWIVFNGEIYNHSEIRAELEQKGYRFVTDHSDTEVILNAYAAWGTAAIDRFRGMFAFVLWDSHEDTFWVARDRLGVKPLYYAEHNGCFYFGSEIKAILADPSFPRYANRQALYHHLTFCATPPTMTAFDGVVKLAPAHHFLIKKGVVQAPVRYWHPFQQKFRGDISEAQAAEELMAMLTTSVQYRRQADVPYGAFLSGGVDSSAIVALLATTGDSSVKTFSVGFSNELSGYKNEFEYARKVADYYKTEHYEVELTAKDLLDSLPLIIHHLDEPITDTACIPLYYVSKLAKDKGVTVCLGGEGSDEALVGYVMWRRAFEAQQLANGLGAVGRMMTPIAGLLAKAGPIASRRPYYQEWIPRIAKNQKVFWGGVEFMTEERKQRDSRWKEQFGLESSWEIVSQYEQEYNRLRGDHPYHELDFMSFYDLSFRLPENLLGRLDRMTMAASIEGRVPFLDHKFIELAMSIPASMKIANGKEKVLLKKGSESLLPHEVIYREKDGFTVPLKQLLANQIESHVEPILNRFNTEAELMDSQTLQAYVRGSARDAWQLSSLAQWYDTFNVSMK